MVRLRRRAGTRSRPRTEVRRPQRPGRSRVKPRRAGSRRSLRHPADHHRTGTRERRRSRFRLPRQPRTLRPGGQRLPVVTRPRRRERRSATPPARRETTHRRSMQAVPRNRTPRPFPHRRHPRRQVQWRLRAPTRRARPLHRTGLPDPRARPPTRGSLLPPPRMLRTQPRTRSAPRAVPACGSASAGHGSPGHPQALPAPLHVSPSRPDAVCVRCARGDGIRRRRAQDPFLRATPRPSSATASTASAMRRSGPSQARTPACPWNSSWFAFPARPPKLVYAVPLRV